MNMNESSQGFYCDPTQNSEGLFDNCGIEKKCEIMLE
jgi:hypothetical protein